MRHHFSVLLLMITIGLNAQDSIFLNSSDSVKLDSAHWSSNGVANLHFSNIGLSNWAGGGQSALSLSTDVDYSVNYACDRIIWDNDMQISYGVTKADDIDEFRKTDDQLLISSIFGRLLTKHSYISSAVEFRTQLTNGFDYHDEADTVSKTLVSSFLAPGYLSLNLGWTARQKDRYSLTIAPFMGKYTFVLNDSLAKSGAFGVDPGKNVRFEGGIGISGSYKKTLMKNLVFGINTDFFANYKDLLTVDVNIKSSIKMKVNDLISTSISASLIYDEDVEVQRDDGTVGPAVQTRNMINVGFFLKI